MSDYTLSLIVFSAILMRSGIRMITTEMRSENVGGAFIMGFFMAALGMAGLYHAGHQ